MDYKIVKFRGIKNDETKKTSGGYLFVEFLKDLKTKRKTGVGNATQRLKGEIVGFSVNGANRKEATEFFSANYIIS